MNPRRDTRKDRMTKVTNNDIATDFELWGEYMDTDGILTEDEFEAMPRKEKLQEITDCFGDDGSA